MAFAVMSEQENTAETSETERELNPASEEEQERVITHPVTIEELQQYCAQKGMPLLRMRFFIGEDYKEPRAFGIYRDGDNFVVYKNKDTGYRAIRYCGPDEAFAVNEIFQKLLSECHLRGIYPDAQDEGFSEEVSRGYREKSKASGVGVLVGVVALIAVIGAGAAFGHWRKHRDDGYYRIQDTTYYRYGDDWSVYDPVASDWYWDDTVTFPDSNYSGYSVGDTYSSEWYDEWGVSNIESSTVWDNWNSYDYSGSYDSSYDSWDSGTTDWGSDW